jgi:hypothetical protein
MLKSKFLFEKVYDLTRIMKGHYRFTGLLVFLLFFSSCEHLTEAPVITEAVVEDKFNRDSFLQAINKASLEYASEIKKSKKHMSFRTVYDSDIMIHSYIERIASGFNSPSLWYKPTAENSWPDPYEGHHFKNEAVLDKSSLTPKLKTHIDNFESSVDALVTLHENDRLTDTQAIHEIKSILNTTGNQIKTDGNLPLLDRIDLAEIFFLTNKMSEDLILVLEDASLEEHRVKSKFLRAFFRVALAVAITAAIVYTGAAALSLLKFGSVAGAHSVGTAALAGKVVIGASGKLYPALMTGIGTGLKTAGSNWEKDWQGIVKEGKYAIKIAW